MSNNNQQIKAHRKLKYGTLSVGFVVIVVVLCIAINLVASGLSAKWDLRVDITDNAARYYTISDATKNIFAEYFKDDPDWQIKIRFLAPEDKITDEMVLELARSYVSEFNGHVEIVFNDILGDPAFASEYTTLTQTALTTSHVIVEGKYHARAVSFNAFYYFDSETGEKAAFTGEKTYTAAILRSGLKESPKAVFTIGHGESVDGVVLSKLEGERSEAIEQVAYMVPLFDSLYDMGFEVQVVDLNKSELPAMTRLVIVCNPQDDFIGFNKESGASGEEDSEIDVLRKYMNQYGTSLIVAVNNSTPELPVLMEYMQQEYGLSYVPRATVTDNTQSVKGSGGRTILGSLPKTNAYSVNAKILSGFIGDERFAFNDTVRLTVEEGTDRVQGEGVLMNSSASAMCEGVAGTYPIFAFNSNAKAIEDPTGGTSENYIYKTAYLLGSTDFLSAEGLVSQYANRALLESVLRIANTVQEFAAVKEVSFVSEALDITTGQARMWTIVVTFVVPMVVFTAAAVVWVKRRHS